ncbi:MAG: STAS domain-containing protein [Planctomycetota bacterium]
MKPRPPAAWRFTERGTHTGAEGAHVLSVALAGEIDADAVPPIKLRLEELLHDAPAPTHLVLDASRVEFMQSAGVGYLILVHRQLAARGGSLSLVHPRTQLRSTLQILGVLPLFDIYVDEPSALADLGVA